MTNWIAHFYATQTCRTEPHQSNSPFIQEFRIEWLPRKLQVLYIQGVTGPHRQNDRDDRPCREDHFL